MRSGRREAAAPWLLLGASLALLGCPNFPERPGGKAAPGPHPPRVGGDNRVPRGSPDRCLGGGDAAQAAVRFAVIGDFGQAGPDEAAVSALVAGWQPDFVITVGDNNYPLGEASTIDQNIGQYF